MSAPVPRHDLAPPPAQTARSASVRASTSTRLLTLTLGFALASTLAACTVGPDYVKPPTTTAATYKELEGTGWKPAQPADTLTRGAWWSIYADPSLDTLEQQVATANQNVQAAAIRARGPRRTCCTNPPPASR
jgi:hypothetical protein